eukprot:m.243205 g.243205  ORF g.243205 m.243205 type:complete len:292 (-) comp14193_c0_seq1:174-1049(-)
MASRARWGILAKAIRESASAGSTGGAGGVSDAEADDVSVRSFKTFGLFETAMSERTADGQWIRYIWPGHAIEVRLESKPLSLRDMMGFNNTGNVCVWPSEEVLAMYCLHNPEIAAGQTVCELGAGMTGLAALCVAVALSPARVHITDGNARSVAGLRACIDRNASLLAHVPITAAELAWGPGVPPYHGDRFDLILCADCLFFQATHGELAMLLDAMLAPQGVCLMMAPRRGGTLAAFCDRLRQSTDFGIDLVERYDDDVWHRHEQNIALPTYKPDLHYPVMLRITRPSVGK